MLHKSYCPRIQIEAGKNYTTNEYRKVYSTNLTELEGWVKRNDTRALKFCKMCNGQPATNFTARVSTTEQHPFQAELTLYADYSREEVQQLFAPEAQFTVGAGTWGTLGIVPIPNRPRDFVFLVTLGQQQGTHKFDEGITTEGVLSWQSQPQQTLKAPTIEKLIAHDELANTIYLFLRPREGNKYTHSVIWVL